MMTAFSSFIVAALEWNASVTYVHIRSASPFHSSSVSTVRTSSLLKLFRACLLRWQGEKLLRKIILDLWHRRSPVSLQEELRFGHWRPSAPFHPHVSGFPFASPLRHPMFAVAVTIRVLPQASILTTTEHSSFILISLSRNRLITHESRVGMLTARLSSRTRNTLQWCLSADWPRV